MKQHPMRLGFGRLLAGATLLAVIGAAGVSPSAEASHGGPTNFPPYYTCLDGVTYEWDGANGHGQATSHVSSQGASWDACEEADPDPVTYIVTISTAGDGSGSTSGAGTYEDGAEVTLSATADADSTFQGWSGDAQCGDAPFTVSSDVSCTATFVLDQEQQEPGPVTFSVSIATTGDGSGSTSGNGTYNDGDEATLSATADAGSTFQGWSGDAQCGDAPFIVASDVSCTATFALVPQQQVENDTENNTPVDTGAPFTAPVTDPLPISTPEPVEEPEPAEEPEAEVEVLGTSAAVTKELTSHAVAMVGETVTFRVTVTLSGNSTVEAGILDTFEHEYLEYLSSTAGDCMVLPNYPSDGLSSVACDLGEVTPGAESASGTISLSHDFSFRAVQSTLPGRTVNLAYAGLDGDLIGPAEADVEIVEVLGLQLPPAGDGQLAASSDSALQMAVLLAALLLGAGGVAAGVRRFAIRVRLDE